MSDGDGKKAIGVAKKVFEEQRNSPESNSTAIVAFALKVVTGEEKARGGNSNSGASLIGGGVTTGLGLVGTADQMGETIFELVTDTDFKTEEGVHKFFSRSADVVKTAGEAASAGTSLAGVASAPVVSAVIGGFQASRHIRKTAKSAHRIHMLRLKLKEMEKEGPPLDIELLKYAIKKNAVGTARNSLTAVAGILGVAGGFLGWNPAGWALLGVSSAIGLGLTASKFGSWAVKRSNTTKAIAIARRLRSSGGPLEDQWESSDISMVGLPDHSAELKSQLAAQKIEEKKVSIKLFWSRARKAELEEEYRGTESKEDETRKWQDSEGEGHPHLLPMMAREYWANYLAGRVDTDNGSSAADCFGSEVIYALFQDRYPKDKAWGFRVPRRSKIKVVKAALYESTPPAAFERLLKLLDEKDPSQKERSAVEYELRDKLASAIYLKLRSTSSGSLGKKKQDTSQTVQEEWETGTYTL